MNYPRWLEELVEKTSNPTLYEAYEILSECLEDKMYSRKELETWGIEADKDFSKEALIFYLLVNSNFYVFM